MKRRMLCAMMGAALLMTSCGKGDDITLASRTEEETSAVPAASAGSVSDQFTVDIVPDDPITGSFAFTVEGLDPGSYLLTAECSYSGGADLCYLYVDEDVAADNELDCTSLPVGDGQEIKVWGVNVTSPGSTVEIGAHIDEGLDSRLMVRSLHLMPDTARQGQEFLFGGALSRISYVESTGAKFYDESGAQIDPVEFMGENGMNFCRLELYNNPGKGRGDGTYYCPDGFQDIDDILAIAKRADKAGMEIELSFMFSDFWTTGIPSDFVKDYEGITDEKKIVDILEADTYSYVKEVMEKLKAQGTVPKYVSLGNEMDPGFFLPYGDSSKHMDQLARFLNAGYRAVKDVSADSQVVLHISCNADDMKWKGKGTGNWFFGECKKYNVNYDVIGTSFYPFWAETLTVDDLVNWCDLMSSTFDKDILIMETGFNWNKYTETGSRGQLYNMGAYEGVFDYSPEGQRDYMNELINGIKSVKDGRCIGFLYWDPIMVAGKGIGWSYKEYNDKAGENVISNTTWFDFDHKALKVFDSLRYN